MGPRRPNQKHRGQGLVRKSSYHRRRPGKSELARHCRVQEVQRQDSPSPMRRACTSEAWIAGVFSRTSVAGTYGQVWCGQWPGPKLQLTYPSAGPGSGLTFARPASLTSSGIRFQCPTAAGCGVPNLTVHRCQPFPFPRNEPTVMASRKSIQCGPRKSLDVSHVIVLVFIKS